jgi:UDP-glucuronate decarboxylase
MVDAFLRVMATEDEFLGPINLGNPTEFSIRQLAEIEMTGARSQLVFKPLPSDDPKQRQPDIALARKTLGWAPTIELRDGLKRAIEYFRTVV